MVRSEQELERLADGVRAWLERYFPVDHLRAVDLRLEPISHFDVHQRGEMRLASNGRVHDVVVALPDDITEENALEALAHEYGHVLLAIDPHSLTLENRQGRTARQEEGFCEVLRWLWLAENATFNREERMRWVSTNLADDYREGFKDMVAALAIVGTPAALREWVVNDPLQHPPPQEITPSPVQISEPVAPRSSRPMVPLDLIGPSAEASEAARPVLDLIRAADRIATSGPDPTAPTWSNRRPVLTLEPLTAREAPSAIAPDRSRPTLKLK